MNRRDQKVNFTLTGPVHLTSVVDWGNSDYRRSVAASLVNGVYVLESDRQNNRSGHKALAPDWWKSFQFECKQHLIDKSDSSIFGAIFEYQPYKSPYNNFEYSLLPQQTAPPRYVIAFRGTILEESTARQDISLGKDIILNKGLIRRSRYQIAIQVVGTITNMTNHQSVWLTGHSLGAGIALLVGKHMAKVGTFIQTFVFNPPFPCAAIDKIINTLFAFKPKVAALLLLAAGTNSNKITLLSAEELVTFVKLCCWVPNLFINPNDPICCEYIRYFEHRSKTASKIEIADAFGRSDGDTHHLIPSALLTKNIDPMLCKDFKRAHSVTQWWTTSLPNYQHRLYNWKDD